MKNTSTKTAWDTLTPAEKASECRRLAAEYPDWHLERKKILVLVADYEKRKNKVS